MPRGTARFADTELEPWLKAKSLIARRDVSDSELKTPSFAETLVATSEQVLPLLAFGWDAMEPA